MLIEFYGRECPHCQKMQPVIERVEREEGVTIEKYEVWHNDENLKKLKEYERGVCGGVPFFLNDATQQFICGETTYENLRTWTQGGIPARNHSPLKDIDYNHIANGIYIGTNQCCQSHFDEQLKKEGIEADISLEEERIDASFGVKFYLWIPVKNHTAPTQDQLDIGVAMVEKMVSAGKKVYVHCENGHGRAPTLVAAYLIRQGRSFDEAVALIKQKRSAMHLEKAQQEALAVFAKRVNERN